MLSFLLWVYFVRWKQRYFKDAVYRGPFSARKSLGKVNRGLAVLKDTPNARAMRPMLMAFPSRDRELLLHPVSAQKVAIES